jgi:hypothetical protein
MVKVETEKTQHSWNWGPPLESVCVRHNEFLPGRDDSQTFLCGGPSSIVLMAAQPACTATTASHRARRRPCVRWVSRVEMQDALADCRRIQI